MPNRLRAQQPPAQQPSAQQPADQSSSQEASTEETTRTRKAKVHDYKNWTFNVGGGASLTNGTTTKFVRGGGIIGAAGVARNYGKYFGFRLDFQLDNLPLRNSALGLAQAPGATSHVYSFTLDPIINIPVTKVWSGYAVFGPGYFHRSGKLDSSDRGSGNGLQFVLELVGNLLQRQRPYKPGVSFHQPERVWIELRRGHRAQDYSENRTLRRVPLPARHGRGTHHGLAADYGWAAVVRKGDFRL